MSQRLRSASGRASWSSPACAARASPAASPASSSSWRARAALGEPQARAGSTSLAFERPAASSGAAVRRAGRAPEVELAALVRAHLGVRRSARARRQRRTRARCGPRGGRGGGGAVCAELLAFGPAPWPIVPAAYPAAARPADGGAPGAAARAEASAAVDLGRAGGAPAARRPLLLGGLNEGSLAAHGRPRPLAQRGPCARQLGLPPVERRIGLAAHDFVPGGVRAARSCCRAPRRTPMATRRCPRAGWSACRPCSPAQGAAAAPAADLARAWSATLDSIQGVPRPAPPPQPRPPLAARPRRLSVSDIGTWMEDAYALYAKRILRLAPLDALDADPGALERGIIIHRALERFVAQCPDALPDDALQHLLACSARSCSPSSPIGRRSRAVVAALRAGRALGRGAGARAPPGPGRAAGGGLGRARAGAAGRPLRRCGRAPIGSSSTPTAASRWSTTRPGSRPNAAKVAAGLAPQLPLEAAMVEAGAFDGHGAGRRWRRSCSGTSRATRTAARNAAAGDAPAALAAAALAGLERLIDHYDQADDGLSATAQAARRALAAATTITSRASANGRADGRARKPAATPRRPSSAARPTRQARSGSPPRPAPARPGCSPIGCCACCWPAASRSQILCLTFTKAAAAEMVARVQDDLGRFATLPDAALRDGPAPAAWPRRRRPASWRDARSLLARVLDLPSGLPIMTIHGFCQSLLKRFPLEAGVRAAFRRDRAAHRGRPDARGAGGGAGEPGGRGPGGRSRRSPCCWARARWPRGSPSCASSACAPAPTSATRRGAWSQRSTGRSACRPAPRRRRFARAACADPAIDRQRAARRLPRAGRSAATEDGARCALITAWLTRRPEPARIEGFGGLRDRVPARRRPGSRRRRATSSPGRRRRPRRSTR